ncbi:holo-ACP synthase [Streptococcus panodentis]|uniref:Holo-[acyl-carrier-protein] synthase n=1 Tax=Streptococcus panodentis TaxID=1581472 RepID=A0ABS5AU26_9STRE|nr:MULTISPECIES: holo-ACP synthase [Streptococcus]MBP2620080.1 holo-ACP synthase [Streptococcus panodentis]
MIKGHGIDAEELSSIERAYQKNPRFARKVLTPAELRRFEELKGKRRLEYLAGRWSAKEAFSKAWGTGIGPVSFQDLEILNDSKGAPYFSQSPFAGRIWVSLSHTGNMVIASVILEEEDES